MTEFLTKDPQLIHPSFKNGTLLIVSRLVGRLALDILHVLKSAPEPSTVLALTWHASSSKQKSDMLAVQCADSDLRVWSIAKPPQSAEPKTIRILTRGDTKPGNNHWIAWSKNGRILQYSAG